MKRSRQQIEAVLFDLGGTLVKTAEIPHVMKKILEHRRINRSLNEISSAWKEAEKELNFRDLATLLDEFWIQWNIHILSKLQINSNTRTLAEFIATHWWDYCSVTLYPDAEKMLPLLKTRDYKMGVITNGLQSDVNEILPKVNLQTFFDIVVVIDTLRKMKPDAEVFVYALERLQIGTSNTIFIGDEIDADYRGAQGAGLTAYLIDREGKVHDKSLNKISSLEDLFKLKILNCVGQCTER
jgi:HAD superfamily hydrolase (TIGR01549 family)